MYYMISAVVSILARPTYISETVAGRAYLRGYGKRAYLRE